VSARTGPAELGSPLWWGSAGIGAAARSRRCRSADLVATSLRLSRLVRDRWRSACASQIWRRSRQIVGRCRESTEGLRHRATGVRMRCGCRDRGWETTGSARLLRGSLHRSARPNNENAKASSPATTRRSCAALDAARDPSMTPLLKRARPISSCGASPLRPGLARRADRRPGRGRPAQAL